MGKATPYRTGPTCGIYPRQTRMARRYLARVRTSIRRHEGDWCGRYGIHVWATPAGGGASIFLGAAEYGRFRADVAAAFGERFGFSAFELNAALPAGNYTQLVFPPVVRLGTFGPARAVSVTVR